jgi:AraC-like DNA-binding protein
VPELSFREHAAAAALRPWLASYWCFRAVPGPEPRTHAVIPDGCISLVWVRAPVRRPGRVLGPRATVLQVPVEPGACVLGVRLQPFAGPSLLGVSPVTLRDRVLPLAAMAPALDAALEPALAGPHEEPFAEIDAALAAFTADRPAPDRGIMEAVRAIDEARGLITLAQAAAHAGVAERQFQRRFRAAAGLTFKEYARICRFRAAALQLLVEDTSLARLAALRGYADQSHLLRESARLAGVSPHALRAYLAGIRHALLAP